MRVVFLLGSGISVDADMPSVAAISEQVFSGADVVRHSDATYYIAGEGSANYDWYRRAAEPAIAFAVQLRELADRYFVEYIGGGRRTTKMSPISPSRSPTLSLARAGRWLGGLPPRLALEQEDALHAVANQCGYSATAAERAF